MHPQRVVINNVVNTKRLRLRSMGVDAFTDPQSKLLV